MYLIQRLECPQAEGLFYRLFESSRIKRWRGHERESRPGERFAGSHRVFRMRLRRRYIVSFLISLPLSVFFLSAPLFFLFRLRRSFALKSEHEGCRNEERGVESGRSVFAQFEDLIDFHPLFPIVPLSRVSTVGSSSICFCSVLPRKKSFYVGLVRRTRKRARIPRGTLASDIRSCLLVSRETRMKKNERRT